MLETIVAPSVVLRELDDEPARFVAVACRPDGPVCIGRCSHDGQRLDLFHSSGKIEDAPSIVEAALPIATGSTVASAFEWVALAQGQQFLCVGFSNGGVSFFTPRGAVCLSFALAPRHILRIRVGALPGEEDEDDLGSAEMSHRSRGGYPGAPRPEVLAAAGRRQQLLLLYEGGLLGAVEFESLRLAMRGGSEGGSFRFRMFEMRTRQLTSDVCLLERVPPMDDIFSTDASPALVALGTKPFLSLHRISAEQRGVRSLIGAAASGLVSYARSWTPFSGQPGFDPLSAPTQKSAGLLRYADIQVTSREKAVDLNMDGKFIDHTRVGDVLLPAPPRRRGLLVFGVTCDEFGRVCLFCLETLRCLHIFKGYRDAQVAWLQPRGPDHSALGLVIHAPHRELLELWDVGAPRGPSRVSAAVIGPDCRLLSTTTATLVVRRSGQVDRVIWRVEASPAPAPAAQAESAEQEASREKLRSRTDSRLGSGLVRTGGEEEDEPGSDAYDSAGSGGDAALSNQGEEAAAAAPLADGSGEDR